MSHPLARKWAGRIAGLLLLVVVVRWVFYGWSGGDDRQALVLTVGMTVVMTAAAAFVWAFVTLARTAKARGWLVGVLVVVAGLSFSFVRLRGFDGDLLPVFEWRFGEGTHAVKVTTEPPPIAGEFPQFLGPTRDGRIPEAVVRSRDWSTQAPRLVWQREVGGGWSGFAVRDSVAVTHEQRGSSECVVAYDLVTGDERWVFADEQHFESAIAGDGPRATPAIHGDLVYAYGGTGVLCALRFEDGQSVWRRAVVQDNGGDVPEWGQSCSPLIAGDLVVVSAGGPENRSLVAYERLQGELRWHAGHDPASYSSPLVATLDGVEQIVQLSASEVRGHDPATGTVLWQFPWSSKQVNVTNPVVTGPQTLLVSAGYGYGAKSLLVTRDKDGVWTAREQWHSRRLKSKFSNMILYQDAVYAFDDGILTCVDPKTGARLWKEGRHGHGQILLVNDLLVVQTEWGEVVLVEPSAAAYRELTRFRAFDEKTWNPPAGCGELLVDAQ